jgi:hypothetical protein
LISLLELGGTDLGNWVNYSQIPRKLGKVQEKTWKRGTDTRKNLGKKNKNRNKKQKRKSHKKLPRQQQFVTETVKATAFGDRKSERNSIW